MMIDELQRMIGQWSVSTFGAEVPYAAIIAHLRKEVKELANSQEPEEAADCLILLLALAHRMGFSLEFEALRKHHVNMMRKWEPTDEGFWRHVEET